MNCISCRAKILVPIKAYDILQCSNCDNEYLVVESIPIMVDSDSDFYRYNRKFKRLVDLKNEQSSN